MFPVRYFSRRMVPTITGIFFGYLLGRFVIFVPKCHQKSHVSFRKNIYTHYAAKEPDIYRWEEYQWDKPIYQKSNNRSGFLYIAMMSAEKFLDTRAIAAAETWAQETKHLWNNSVVKIEIFASGQESIKEINVVQLPGVPDNVYPPQRKSFSMLRYLAENYINEYDWFVRLDDDAFISWSILEKLLRRLDPTEPLYIGSPGFGKDDEDYVEEDMTYCMGGPGIIMSKELLRLLSPHLHTCLKNLMTEHEDLELGRCIQDKLGISCIRSYEANRLFKQNYEYNTQNHEQREKMFEEIAASSIATYHPNKNSQDQYSLYRAFKKQNVNNMMKNVHEFEHELNISHIEKSLLNRPDTPLHQLPVFNDRVTVWNQFTGGRFFDTHKTVHRISPAWVEAISVGARETAKLIYKTMRLTGRITKITVPEVYSKIYKQGSELMGTIVMRHSVTESNGKVTNQNVNSRIRMNYAFLNRPFIQEEADLLDVVRKCIIDEARTTSECRHDIGKIPVKIIIPLSGRSEALENFLARFESLILEKNEHIHLIIVNFPNGKQSTEIESVLDELRLRLPKTEMQVLDKEGDFNRGIGLQAGALKLAHMNDLLFFCDVDIIINEQTLRRIRYQTLQGSTVYYPVVFSKFQHQAIEDRNELHLAESQGFWREYGFGMVSIYKSDFDNSGGFDMTLQGWGLEDIHLATNIIRKHKSMMRANDPSLIHPWHEKKCATNLSAIQFTSCTRTRSSHIGSHIWLYDLYKQKNNQS